MSDSGHGSRGRKWLAIMISLVVLSLAHVAFTGHDGPPTGAAAVRQDEAHVLTHSSVHQRYFASLEDSHVAPGEPPPDLAYLPHQVRGTYNPLA